jgi:hypothetical protein
MDISYSFAMLSPTPRVHRHGQESERATNNYQTRALMLSFGINQQATVVHAVSHKGRRAKRIMQRLSVRMAAQK